MSGHLLKLNTPLSDPRMRCGIGVGDAEKGAKLCAEDGDLSPVDCAGCLRDLVYDMRREGKTRDKAGEWLVTGEVGSSSATIWHVMTGRGMPGRHYPSPPLDPDDFRRCHLLLEQFPEWRARLGEVAARYPQWSGLVQHWDELTALLLEELPKRAAPKTYARMRELMA